MAADAYLKAAASQLLQGASALKQEADAIRAQAATFKQQAEHDLTTMQAEIQVKKTDQLRNKDIPATFAALTAQIQKIQHDIDRRKQELAQNEAAAQQAIRVKESGVQSLSSQAQSLEGQAGNPAFR